MSSKPVFYYGARHHLLGVGENEQGRYYGIWDIRNPGPALERFDATMEGEKQAIKRVRRLNSGNPPIPLNPRIACPTCGVQGVRPITATDKFASAALVGVFALGKMSKSFKCFNCGYSW